MQYKWSEDLATGNAKIDAQHRRIISEVGVLSEALKGHRGKEQGPATFRFLAGYIRDHFRMEERLMEDARFPGLGDHAAQHAHIADRLKDLEATLHEEGPTVNFLLLLNRMCLDWLFTHILTRDREMARFLRGGTQTSPSEAPPRTATR